MSYTLIKKIATWFLIGVSVLCLLILVLILVDTWLESEEYSDGLLDTRVGTLICIMFFSGVLWGGIKILRKLNPIERPIKYELGKIRKGPITFFDKLKGVVLMISFSFSLLIYCYVMSSVVGDILSNPIFEFKEIAGLLLMFIPVVLLWTGLRYAIRIVDVQPLPPKVAYSDKMNIYFKGTISYREYRKFSFGELLRYLPYFVVIYIFIFLVFYSAAQDGLGIVGYMGIVITLFPIILIFIVFSRLEKMYYSSKNLSEEVEYLLTNNFVRLISDSMDIEFNWDIFIKIRETKDFILLYQTATYVTYLPKKVFKEADLIDFKLFLKSLSNS